MTEQSAVNTQTEFGNKLLVASHNAGKVKELQDLLSPYGLECVTAADLDLPEPEETEDTYEGNALLKAMAAAKESGLPSLADDSGFSVTALNGDPGVYSARWAGEPRDFNKAMAKVNELLKGHDDRSAKFVCVIALAFPNGDHKLFRGEIEGTVIEEPRGDNGFGYDPIFVPDGYDHTFAEIATDEKQKISHRARAMKAFVDNCFR